jgi:CRP-like cAMP-binding protein
MTSLQREVHLRLMEQLRERTRTHICEAAPQRNGVKYCGKKRIGLLERLKKCQAEGMTRKQMADACGTSSKTIVRLLGKVRFVCLSPKK